MRLLTSGPSALLLAASLTLATPALAATSERAAGASAAEPAISIAAKSTQVERGKKVVVTGAVTNKRVTRVTLQQKRVGTKWKAQATAKVKANGTYKLKDKTTTAVTRKYRVVSAAGPKQKSAKVTVGVYAWRDLTKVQPRVMNGWSVEKTVNVNGVAYGPAYRGWVHPTLPSLVDYNLNRECISLRARFGISDASDLAARATISVLGDDVPVYSKSFGLTQSEYVTLPLGSPFRVGLTYTVENPGGLPTPPNTVPVVAQPEAFCTSAK
ncbi:hypothetical protein KVF89_11470 [Nocardioides carbamazepini]|uniref:hypothetical protein n=1 Tax=Nocardioides carbamazepini TaxID=2854259 RepID=UPI002149E011|nr:hypothetical protein [Nocardioides carbamazepini]MCR1783153.1 hypothetical protein [Nocardioides carbamazepini]